MCDNIAQSLRSSVNNAEFILTQAASGKNCCHMLVCTSFGVSRIVNFGKINSNLQCLHFCTLSSVVTEQWTKHVSNIWRVTNFSAGGNTTDTHLLLGSYLGIWFVVKVQFHPAVVVFHCCDNRIWWRRERRTPPLLLLRMRSPSSARLFHDCNYQKIYRINIQKKNRNWIKIYAALSDSRLVWNFSYIYECFLQLS